MADSVVKSTDGFAAIRNATRGTLVADRAIVANTSEKRRTGLLKHDSLPEGEALWIVPCEGVHSFGMKFPIDIVYLNRKKVVVKLRRNMVRSRMSFCLTAHSVVELPVGMIDKSGTAVGDQLEVIR